MTLRALAVTAVLCAGCAAQKANSPTPNPTALRKQLARTLLGYREWAMASQPLRELVIVHPEDSEVRAMLGTTYRELGLYGEAEVEYQTACKLDPRQAEAHEGLGILADLRGDKGDAALASLQKAIELQPENAAFYNNLGFAYYQRGRFADAEAAFHEALRRDPSMRRSRNNLGFTYAQRGDFQGASREFERGGSRAMAVNNLGFVLERTGKPEAACERYRQAEQLDPLFEIARSNAARVCAGGSLSPERSGL